MDILKIIIFSETLTCFKFYTDRDDFIIDCQDYCKTLRSNNIFLGYILYNNEDSCKGYGEQRNYIKELKFKKEDNQYKLEIPGIGIIPNNKILFTSKYHDTIEINYETLEKFTNLTLFNFNNHFPCTQDCTCYYKYNVLIKKIGDGEYCVSHISIKNFFSDIIL